MSYMEKVTPADFKRWLTESTAGDRLCYAVGPTVAVPGGREETADAAYQAYENDQIILTQKRQGENLFEYIAIKVVPEWQKRVNN